MSISVIFMLMTSVAVTTVAAFPNDAIRSKTFITYVGDEIGEEYTDTYDVFEYSGIRWSEGSVVTYIINTNGAPEGAVTEISEAFETWDAVIVTELFNNVVEETIIRVKGNGFDGKNVISWRRLRRGAIAMATVWFNRYTLEIVEFGIVFNTAYTWGIDIDGKEGTEDDLVDAFDIQNIATHEAGHTLMLLDLYMPEACALTMYGYGAYGETYARTLGTGDKNGIEFIYGS